MDEILNDLVAQLDGAEHPRFDASALQAGLLARLAARMSEEGVSVAKIAEIATFAARTGRCDGNPRGIAEIASSMLDEELGPVTTWAELGIGGAPASH